MNYPINYPFAGFFRRLGFTMLVRIDVVFDKEAGVFIATSSDVPGLVLESETFDGLTNEVQEAVINLTNMNNIHHDKTTADLIYKDHIVIA